MKHTKGPLDKLKYHVTGAIERGEKQAIKAVIKPKYTPGPWKFKRLESFEYHCDDINVTLTFNNHANAQDATIANAALIAAAPEMLEALEHCLAFFDAHPEIANPNDDRDCSPWNDARQALNKAKGE